MTVNQILSTKGKEVFSVLPTNTVYEALTAMSEKNIGAILVIEDTVLKGILSERDYARKIVLKAKSSKKTLVHGQIRILHGIDEYNTGKAFARYRK
jgi:CBS domain-containing protein